MHTPLQDQLVPTLESARLHLRPFAASDAQALYAYASDGETVKHLTWAAHASVQESEGTIQTILSHKGVYAIVLKESNHLIGCIDLRILTPSEASFGYVLNRAFWNKGYTTEALQTALSYLFAEVGIKTVVGCHERDNPASKAVMKKCGMRWTHLAKDETISGKTTDNDHYLITSDEWLLRSEQEKKHPLI
ncbi:MAG: GNAT family N-acetyltransferase [Sphaerochaeta sp.]|nr:GNAT family N-acetyltransferase [Sphaerochaeta sp.]